MDSKEFLVVDDESDIRELLQAYLTSQGHTVLTASNGEEALAIFKQNGPDLVILDVKMPGMDGFEVLRKIRKSSQVPVIMLTARTASLDTVQGLHSGADDYVHKPFDLAVLDARIKAVIRRSKEPERELILTIGEFIVDDESKTITRNGAALPLTPREYDLFRCLASQPGKVFSHDEIIAVVWPGESIASSMDVIKYVNLLRQKIEADPKNPEVVLTVRGFGYKLSASV
ncbi:response regulator transcription factor [Candidatus Acetothermia bacterium]|nr:response regulator transcription factor [Candidatus Acetothermia bacterium]